MASIVVVRSGWPSPVSPLCRLVGRGVVAAANGTVPVLAASCGALLVCALSFFEWPLTFAAFFVVSVGAVSTAFNSPIVRM